jgi:integrase
MARMIGKLTALDVSRAKRRGYYGDGGGLYLVVGPNGGKSWVFRFRKDGKLRDMGLGPLHTIGLADVREKARECRRLRLEGQDPLEIRKASRLEAKIEAAKAMTFAGCAEAYIKVHRAGWRNSKHAAQWPSSLASYTYPIFGSLPVQAIDTALVMRALEQIWTVKPETASRVRGRIESVLDWATARDYRRGENPARWRGHLENLLPKRSKVRAIEHHAALPYDQLAEFTAELRQQEGVAARALELTILTAARTGETLGAQWSEFDLSGRLWTVPGKRMKAGKEHRIPLSASAISVLDEMQAIRQSDFVFPGAKSGRPLSGAAFRALLSRMGRSDLTVHGFRSTFSDWCSEHTNFPAEVREMALAHVVGDKVEAAYRRGDLFEKRRQLMAAWANFAISQPGDNVVSITAVG